MHNSFQFVISLGLREINLILQFCDHVKHAQLCHSFSHFSYVNLLGLFLDNFEELAPALDDVVLLINGQIVVHL